MRLPALGVVLALTLFLTGGEALAQEAQRLGTISRGTPTVPAILQVRGCHPDWLSLALAYNRILPDRANQLERNGPIFLPIGLCHTTPPPDVTYSSQMIRAAQQRRPTAPRVRRVVARTPSLSSQLESANRSVATLNDGLAKSKEQVGVLDDMVQKAASTARTITWTPTPIVQPPLIFNWQEWKMWPKALWGLIALTLVLGGVLALSFISYKNRGTVFFPSFINEKASGIKRRFRRISLVEEVATYECETCGEQIVYTGKGSLKPHVRLKCAKRP